MTGPDLSFATSRAPEGELSLTLRQVKAITDVLCVTIREDDILYLLESE
jgi:hypothetical protein